MDEVKKVKCLILEDEQLGLVVLKDYISRIPFLEITTITSNGSDALKLIESNSYDLLFLDIQVPVLSGVELLKRLQKPPKTIFTTAFPEYAVDAFELDAVDYLVKPYSFERFEKAVLKVLKLSSVNAKQSTDNLGAVEANRAFIYLKSGGAQVKVLLDQIAYIESQRNVLLIHLNVNRTITTYLTINELEDRLPKALFVRIHKSFIVSLSKIESYNSSSLTIDGHPFAIGRSYKDEALPIITNYFKV